MSITFSNIYDCSFPYGKLVNNRKAYRDISYAFFIYKFFVIAHSLKHLLTALLQSLNDSLC